MIKFDEKSGKYSFTSSTGKVYSSANKKYVEYQFSRNGGKAEVSEMIEEKAEEFTINERFDFISKFVTMVADKIQPAMIITGQGGLGKTVTVNKTLQSMGYTDVSNTENFIEGERLPTKHYRVIKGYSTAKSLFRTLYENRDSILVFDDCDSVLAFPDAANLLKGALDSNSERIISWNSEGRMGEDDLPRSFRFTGGVIFISNLNKEKIPQALRTRSVCVDVSMTLEQKIERMEFIVKEDDFMPEADMSIKNLAMKIVKQNKDKAREVSMRSLMQVVRIGMKFTGKQFEDMSKYALCN